MNLHRYIAKLTSPSSGESRIEFLGTWIGFAGLILFILHLAVANNVRDAAGPAVFVIGLIYCIYWFSTQHKNIVYFLAFITGIGSIILGWLSISNLIGCYLIEYEFGGTNCNKMDFIRVIYFAYFLSTFLISIYYIRVLRAKTA